MNYIMSTLTSSVAYTFYRSANGVKVVERIIEVKGGSYRRDPKTLQMAQGIVTEVSDEELAKLRSHPLFLLHEKNSEHIVVKSKSDAEKAKGDGADGDASRQLTEKDYKKRGKKAPKTVKQSNADAED
jgi:hypothetical protein